MFPSKFSLALAALVLPALRADIHEQNLSFFLNPGDQLDVARGLKVSSGGDLLWTGNEFAPQGTARLRDISQMSTFSFQTLDEKSVLIYASSATSASVPGSGLGQNRVLVAVANGGAFVAKMQVTNFPAPGGMLNFIFTSYSEPTPPPSITSVSNNSSLIRAGLPNSGIAPSTLFVIFGTNLAAPGATAVLQDSTQGLPTKLNGASILVTVGETTVTPAIYYATPTAIAGVLPAATPIGSGTLNVTYNGATSIAFPIQVVPSAFGITSYNAGSAVATDAVTGALLTPAASGKPGQTIILWGTGLGADSADSDTTYTGSPHPINTQLDAYIGGVKVTNVAYTGASVYPGVQVIGLTIPAEAPHGCNVPVTVITGGNVISNAPLLPIADGGGPCSDPQFGADGNTIANLNAQSTIRIGRLSVIQQTIPGFANGVPAQITLGFATATFQAENGSAFFVSAVPSVGTCRSGGTRAAAPVAAATTSGLDAGGVTVNGITGSADSLYSFGGGLYSNQYDPGVIPSSSGVFTFNGGTTSGQVGPFTATVQFPKPLLVWTNQDEFASLAIDSPPTFKWSGGAPGSVVVVSALSFLPSGAGGSFTCSVRAELGQFTVPSNLMLGIPAGAGQSTVTNFTMPVPFSAPNLDFGNTVSEVTIQVNTTFK